MFFDVGTQGRIAGISPAFRGRLALTWLHIAHLFPQMVKAERQMVTGVQETTLTQVAVFGDQNLEREDRRSLRMDVVGSI